jgi:hypothetical protein
MPDPPYNYLFIKREQVKISTILFNINKNIIEVYREGQSPPTNKETKPWFGNSLLTQAGCDFYF